MALRLVPCLLPTPGRSLADPSVSGAVFRYARSNPLIGPDSAKPPLIVTVGVECRVGSGTEINPASPRAVGFASEQSVDNCQHSDTIKVGKAPGFLFRA